MSIVTRRPAPQQAIDYDPFAGGVLSRVVPSTEPQREIWLADQLGRDASLAYNESVSLHLRGRLDVSGLRKALQMLLDRHSALRANFGPDGETLCVTEHVDLDLDVRDLTACDTTARQAAVRERRRAAVETPFSLLDDRLLRIELLVLDADDHLLIMTAHHIVCDGWSWWVLVRELGSLYAMQAGAEVAPLPPADDFADYALAQAMHPGGAAFSADETYWLSRFDGAIPVLDLPADRPRPARRSFASAREDCVLDAELVSAVRALGARRGVSLFAALLASFATLLSRLTNQPRIVLGIPTAGQAVGGHDHLVGHCVNTLPLLFDVDLAQPATGALDAAQATLLEALEHQSYTFGTLLAKLRIERDPSRLPLISVMFNIDQALDHESSAFPGVDMEFESNPRGFENFELSVNAVQEHGQLRLETQYNRELFDGTTVRRWLDAFETLLRAAVQRPQAPLRELPLLDRDALVRLRALQPAPTPFAQEGMHGLFEAQCERTPDRVAVRVGNDASSYAELENRANRIAHLLRGHGVRRGALVGIALDRGIDMLAAMLGVLKSGAGYVPLDPAYPQERLNHVVSDAGLAALLTDGAHAARFDLRGRPVLELDRLDAELAAAPATRLDCDADAATPDSIAYVIYTSGSTGQPKGVEIPHRAVVNFLTGMRGRPGLHADDRLLAVTTLSFDIAVLELFGPLSVGAEVVLASREDAMDGEALKALLADSRATLMQATPATWRVLLDTDWTGADGFRAWCGGEALPPNLATALLARCGEVWNLYGPTETTVWSTCWRVQRPEQGIRIGTPIANTTVWILDEQRQPCPIGVPGEIWIGGAGVAIGYRNQAELTAQRFVVDPCADAFGGRMYRTGDRGRWLASGTLEHLGRLDTQVKLRGFRIELGEIESQLAVRPEVAHAIAAVRAFGPSDDRLLAYVVPTAGAAVDEAALRTHLRGVLPDYMIPQQFVVLDAVPLLPNGKVDRKRLPMPADTVKADGVRVAPRDEMERCVAAAMTALLGCTDLGIEDNFFERGGHSLLAAQLVARLNRDLHAGLSLHTVFDAPTVAGMARAIRSGASGSDTSHSPRPRIARRPDRQRAPLSLMQQRVWYLEQMHPGSVTYHTPSAHRLRGAMDEFAFERALHEMVRRQSALRTSIETSDEGTFQHIHDDLQLASLPCEDLRDCSPDQREAVLQQRMEELMAQPFDLAQAPLFRARLFRLDEREHVFFFMTHHIIWDGWSFDLMYGEMSSLYAAFHEGRQPALAPLAVEYGDFAAWHSQWMQGDELARQLAHWRERLSGALEPLELPTDRPRPPRMSGVGATEWIHLSTAQVAALRELGQAGEATLFMVLLTLYYVLLHRLSGQRDLIVSTPVRARDSSELEPVMGFFVNALPLRLQVDPQLPFIELVRSVRSVVVDAFSFPDVPFDRLVTDLKLPRDDSRPPIAQTMFSFQDARQRPTHWADLEHRNIPVLQRGAAEDVGLWFLEHAGGLSGGLTCNVDIFDADTVVRFRERYVALAESALADPRRPVAQLDLLPGEERGLLQHWNANETSTDIERCVHEVIDAQARSTPQRTAVRCGSQSLTYAQLEARSNRIAHVLRRSGARHGVLIGIALDRGVDLVPCMLAVLKTGAGYVPLDPAFPAQRLAFMTDDAQLAALVTERRLADRFDVCKCPLLVLDDPACALDAASAEPLQAADGDPVTPASVAYVIYTSGSTGQPKGVEVPHRAVVNFLAGMRQRPGLDADDRLLAVTTLSFDIAVLELFGPLSVGGEVVLASRDEAMDGDALNALLAASGATLMQATPATWRILLASGWKGGPGFRALCGGEALTEDLATQLLAHCGEVWNLYGPTETTVWSTCWRVQHPEQGISIGTPIANTTVWILDEQRQLCPIGVPGEIWIGGAGVALGYRHRPDLTAERFVADAYAGMPGARLYRTGDRGRWLPDGTLEHLGRLDFQVKLRGFRIELGEVEAAARDESALKDCVAAVHEFNAKDRRLVLYVVSDEPADTLLPRLRACLASRLPGYMQPQHLVALEALPRTPNGKVDRKALPPPLTASAPTEADAESRPTGMRGSADQRQRYLAEVWCELVGIADVQAHDNFFDIGGHSLLAVEMATRVRREKGVRLNLLDIATSTLASLAANLPDTATQAPVPPSISARLRRLLRISP